MKKEIRIIKDKEVMQITCLGERWYARQGQDKAGLPIWEYFPSVTWIAGYYPKGIAFYKWLAEKGWDEAEAIKVAAGDKGSKVHQACMDLDNGADIRIDDEYLNPKTGLKEELSVEEIDCITSYANWHKKNMPNIIANELTVFGKDYAGTIDKITRIGKQIYILDIKTGQNLYPEHELQISAYSHADVPYKDLGLGITDEEWANRKLAILQVGYRRNKDGFKFTEIDDKFCLFLNARMTWENENPESKPKQKDYPLIIKL